MQTYFIYWIIYAFLGYIIETIYVSIPKGKFVMRGFLYGPIIPIYAFGALIILSALNPISQNPFFIFTFGVILTSTLEYITSYLMEKVFDMRWWDYSNKKFNLNGRICLRNSLLFGLLSLLLIQWIHPFIQKFVAHFNPNQINLLSVIFMIILIVDFSFSLMDVIGIKQLLIKLENKFEIEIENMDEKILLLQKNFKKRQARLLRRFPNLKSSKFSNSLDYIKRNIKEYFEK